MGLFSRNIIVLKIGVKLTKDLCLVALDRTLGVRQPSNQLIHHSDCSSQYASKEYIAHLKAHDIPIRISGRANCYDNECIESFHATIKKERVYRQRYKTREEAKMDILKYITAFYNERRMHSTLNYKSPNEFERAYQKVVCQSAS